MTLGALGALAAVAQADSVVTITEFMAANAKTLADRDGDYPDWIEVHNAGPDAANLADWALTDTPGNLVKWRFPSTPLPANTYLVVFASGKDRAVAGQELHTGFSLNAGGEYLALVTPESEVASEFAPRFPEQFVDVSYGIRLGREYFFSKPTPGRANEGGYNDFVADTKFSHDRGFYTQAFELTLSTATADAVIVYTTDGSAPAWSTAATNGLVYAAPIAIRSTTTLRAAAFKDGFQPSNVDTQTYLFLDDVVRQSADGRAPGTGWPAAGRLSTGQIMDYGMDPDVVNNPLYAGTIRADLQTIPSFSIVMDLKDLLSTSTGIYANPGQDTRAWERKCSLELVHPDGRPGFQIDCGIRIRGGFSRSTDNPKHAFRFFFREVYGAPKLRYPLLGDDGADNFDGIDLRTFQNYSWSFQGDSRGVFLRDQFNRDVQLAMGHQAERGEYYHLYLNGQYWGLFNTCERPEASFAETYYGGNKDDYDVVKSAADAGYTILATDGDMAAWTTLYNLCRQGLTSDAAYERILGHNPDGTPNPAYPRLVEDTNLMDYMLIILYGGNLDAPISWFLGNNSPNNWFGLRNRLGPDGFRFFVHDAEHTLLNVNEDRSGPFAAGNASVSVSNPQWIWQQMWANAEFRVQMGDRIHTHFFNGGLLTPEGARTLLLKRLNQLDRAVVGESARWGDAKRATPFTRADWQREADNILNNYVPQRSQIVLNQLKARNLYPATAAPAFNLHGGPVAPGFRLSLTAPAGTTYFTLDGTDPRLRGGALAPAARTYTQPIALTESVVVKARARAGADWSALNAATFTLIQSYTNVVITEIMYHPAEDADLDADEFEFLELQNLNSFAVDLSSVRFTNGVQYAFPLGRTLGPGAFAVLVRNPAAFAQRHPGVPIAGTFTGNLANAGERISLVHAVGTPLFSANYGDAAPWPPAADGNGFSLVPIRPGQPFDADDPSQWRASSRAGGSPGAEDRPLDIPAVVVNEVLTHTDPPQVDSVELRNASTGTADVSGWYLTDDRTVPRKYRIPSDTFIPAGGYLVIEEAQFNPNPGVDPSFTFSSHGEQVFLFSGGADGELTGYSDGFTFDAAANGISFGRHTNSLGEIQFPPQAATTLGGPNPGPAVGPMVINEIRYHPAAGDEEFVELKNISDLPVKLYDPFHPTNTWRFDGVDFNFPPYIEIPPQGLLLLTASDPASFRDRHGVPAHVPVFGPFPGALQDDGELLRLQRPDAPDLETNQLGQVRAVVPYITVDAVRYNDRAPWPTNAAGFGPSLERIRATVYGNDPSNWRASFGPASPGLPNDGNRAPIVSAGLDRQAASAAFPFGVPLQGTATDDGRPGPPSALEARWTQLSGPGPVVFNGVAQLTPTVLLPGPGDYTLRLTVSDGDIAVRDEVVISVTRPSNQITLLPAGSEWRYLDDGSNQGTDWFAPAFNDAAWKLGRAQFGYSSNPAEGDETTTLSYGLNPISKHITYYFRTRFNLANPASVTELTARVLRDDGAAVYLNGWPAFRDNLPTGDLNYRSTAPNAVGGADESTFFEHAMDAARLRAGVNIIAVEIHQNSGTSTDVSFDFQLDGLAFPVDQAPTASAGPDRTVPCDTWVTLAGDFADDGLSAQPGAPAFAWSKVTGPADVDFATPGTWVTDARFAQLGTHVVRLTVNDGAHSASDEATVMVVRRPLPSPTPLSFAVSAEAPPLARLVFNADAGWRHAVEARDSLTHGDWERLEEFTSADSRRALEFQQPIDPNRPSRFYRILALPDE